MVTDQRNRYNRNDPWPDLVVAMLSVNNFPLEKTFAIFEALGSQGLFEPNNYLNSTPDEIAQRLVASGYDRGPTLTMMFGQRLASLREICGDIAGAQRILAFGSRAEVAGLLKSVTGVGPAVLRKFFMLR